MKEIVSKFVHKITKSFSQPKLKYNLNDIWRKHNREKVSYSYINPSQRGYNSRIDFFLCSNTLVPFVKSSDITCAPSSDHKAVDISTQFTNNTRRIWYWKMNVGLLEDKEYIDEYLTLTGLESPAQPHSQWRSGNRTPDP